MQNENGDHETKLGTLIHKNISKNTSSSYHPCCLLDFEKLMELYCFIALEDLDFRVSIILLSNSQKDVQEEMS